MRHAFTYLKKQTGAVLAGAATGITAMGLMAVATGAMAQGAPQAQSPQQPPQPQAQETVAATVNDTMISTFDVRQRMRLMLVTSGGRIPQSAYGQLQERALRDLIEENLKLQEAERLEFTVEDEAIEEELAQIAAGANVSVQQLDQQLLMQNIAPVTIRNQIRSRLVWQRLVAARYRSRIRISDDEIDTVMNRMKADTLGEQFLISEICLPVADESRTEQIYNAGMQMIAEMRRGAPFGALAQQFSICPSAASGGDRGWVRKGELDPELESIITQLQPGSVSVPTLHEGVMHIMALRQKRDLRDGGGEKTFELAYAGAPLSVGEDRAREAFARLRETNVCAGGEISIDLGPDIGVTLLPPMPLAGIQPAFHETLDSMQRGDLSDPIVSGDAFHAVLVCELDEGLGLPSRDQIENRLFADELELISRRYLRDIERDSSVDIRTLAGPPAASGSSTPGTG